MKRDEAAIQNQLGQHKQLYSSKVVPSGDIPNYIRLTSHLQILLLSHSHNIFPKQPEGTLQVLDELDKLMQDLMGKCQELARRDTFINIKDDCKIVRNASSQSGLCTVCA